MPRTILIHLNATVPETASPSEVAEALLAAIEVGADSDEFYAVMGKGFSVGYPGYETPSATLVCALAEEV